jgi:hypothetical protein
MLAHNGSAIFAGDIPLGCGDPPQDTLPPPANPLYTRLVLADRRVVNFLAFERGVRDMRTRAAKEELSFYGELNAPFVTYVRNCVAVNLRVIVEVAKDDVTRIETNLDLQHKIACYYVWAFGTPFYPSDDLTKLLLSAFHKNLFGFFSSLELTNMGLFGPARNLLRQVLEWLVVGKFCSVSHDSEVLESWINGQSISLSRHVLSRVQGPDLSAIRDLWRELCRFTHATKFSQQVSLDARGDEMRAGVFDTIAIIHALLECNYILLNRHLVTPTLIYYAKRYAENYQVPELKQDLRSLFRKSRKVIAPTLRRMVRCYRRVWTIR